jgi:hypothetical protein
VIGAPFREGVGEAVLPRLRFVAAGEQTTTLPVGGELSREPRFRRIVPAFPEKHGRRAVARAEAQQPGLGVDGQQLFEKLRRVLVVDALGIALGIAGLHESLDAREQIG